MRKVYWFTGLLGLALGVAPWVFDYTGNNEALWTSVILGGVVVLVSLYKAVMQDNQYWEYWLAGLAGLVAILAPFVLGFSTLTAAVWTVIIVGALLVVTSGYEVFFVQQESTT